MIPGFEDGIKGHKAGEEFTIDVTFPEEYHAENLKGKAAKFVINLKKVEERELPELTEKSSSNVSAWKMVPSLACALKCVKIWNAS